MLPENPGNSERPGRATEALDVTAGEADDDILERCRRCGHVLVVESSIRLGVGPVCRRLEIAEAVVA
ncbi:DUF6011 domain-containing protein [Nocardioides caldifontis]|uniref:DUF6011 domain-containing protein n=1 Tax=Nocardioides caldifontis TaxID=2588938 RepID=UPI003B845471